MAADVDLFGNPVEESGAQKGTRPVAATNDMNEIEHVLTVAIGDGFALVGPSERVYRRLGEGRIEEVSSHVDALVHQLIDAKWLEVGGTHHFTCGRFEGPGRSVLVPRRTKNAAGRWKTLSRPRSWDRTPREVSVS